MWKRRAGCTIRHGRTCARVDVKCSYRQWAYCKKTCVLYMAVGMLTCVQYMLIVVMEMMVMAIIVLVSVLIVIVL
jgi:hypothetical protein